MIRKLEVLRFPDSRLRNKAKAVDIVTPELSDLAHQMIEIMHQENGVGLSSIQVNKSCRLFVADTGASSNDRYQTDNMGELERQIKQPLICFNPEITYQEGEVIFKEGCLSFPSYFAEVKRSAIVEMKALDGKGKSFTLKTDGLLSICIQHEIDHLGGKLFIDHLSPMKAQRLRERIKKYGYPKSEEVKTP